jgi:hypothetical protein
MTVNLPVGPHVAKEARAFRQVQRMPEARRYRPQGVEDRTPVFSFGCQASDVISYGVNVGSGGYRPGTPRPDSSRAMSNIVKPVPISSTGWLLSTVPNAPRTHGSRT